MYRISIRDDTYQDGSRIYAQYGVLEIIYYDLQPVPVSGEVTITLFVETENYLRG